MSCKLFTHGRSGPLAGRLERLVERARAECRADDLAKRCLCREMAETRGDKPYLCRECGIPLLPAEVDVCRHCKAGRLSDDDTTCR